MFVYSNLTMNAEAMVPVMVAAEAAQSSVVCEGMAQEAQQQQVQQQSPSVVGTSGSTQQLDLPVPLAGTPVRVRVSGKHREDPNKKAWQSGGSVVRRPPRQVMSPNTALSMASTMGWVPKYGNVGEGG